MKLRSTIHLVARTAAVLCACGMACFMMVGPPQEARAKAADYFSPYAVVAVPDGKTAYVSGRTCNEVAVVNLVREKVASTIGGLREPTGLALSADGNTLYVASYMGDCVQIIDTRTNKLTGRLAVGKRPMGVVLSPDGARLYVCNRMSHDVSVVDLAQKKELGRIPAVREPVHAAVTPDGKLLFVANLLPLGRNDDPTLAADITIIDTEAMAVSGTLRLPTGCTDVGQICVSPDGKYAYVVSVLARFLVPPTQITRGWINTNALTIIDVAQKAEYATVLLDELDRGAANPFGITISADGTRLYVSHTGCHEITVLDRAKLHEIIEPIQGDERRDLSRDLTFLYRNGVTTKYPSGGKGPRGLALCPDGTTLLVANYYSDTLTQLKSADGEIKATIAFTELREPDLVRQGEALFYDADLCFQQWQSCASCHPDGRVDALRWDLLNDGLGNPKNAKSMLLAAKTPPAMAHGVRADARMAVEAGIKYILFRQPEKEQVDAIYAFVDALSPEPSPYLAEGGGLTPAAKRGKKLFESDKVGCKNCHPAPLYTDLNLYDVGTRSELDSEGEFDTPTLIELYRTAPYLHDGNAVTLKEVLIDRNPEGKHGNTKDLTEDEINDLIAFLLSL